jgi:hypothetical protein
MLDHRFGDSAEIAIPLDRIIGSWRLIAIRLERVAYAGAEIIFEVVGCHAGRLTQERSVNNPRWFFAAAVQLTLAMGLQQTSAFRED